MAIARHVRTVAFVVLAGVTLYGVVAFARGDWSGVAEAWSRKLTVLPWILLLACADVLLEGVGWSWAYQRLGIRAADAGGFWAYLSGRAGLLLPAQFGRLIRPDAMVRLGRAPLSRCLQAEAASFVLDATSVAALVAFLLAWAWQPLAGPVAALAVVAASLGMGDLLAERLSGTRLAFPVRFWWRWQTGAIVIVQMLGWAGHGLAFYLMVRDLPGDVTLWGALFFAAASSVLGVGSGLPGGIGATEGLLGASLRFMQVPAVHLALTVAAFRIVTFWGWLPIGWLALLAVRRRAAPSAEPESADPEIVLLGSNLHRSDVP